VEAIVDEEDAAAKVLREIEAARKTDGRDGIEELLGDVATDAACAC